MTEWFLYVVITGSSMTSGSIYYRHAMPDLATCEQALSSFYSDISDGDENESYAVAWCATAGEKLVR